MPGKMIQPTEEQAQAIALTALVWTLGDEKRADRLLSLTGLTPDDLRQNLSQRATQAAILAHLANYEPDLIEFSKAEALAPEDIMAAARMLTR